MLKLFKDKMKDKETLANQAQHFFYGFWLEILGLENPKVCMNVMSSNNQTNGINFLIKNFFEMESNIKKI